MMSSQSFVPFEGPISNVGLPSPIDSETMALLRGFLLPILSNALSWDEIRERLEGKGYGVTFRVGHLVVVNLESGSTLCTARALGLPLRDIAARIGRPQLRMKSCGTVAELA